MHNLSMIFNNEFSGEIKLSVKTKELHWNVTRRLVNRKLTVFSWGRNSRGIRPPAFILLGPRQPSEWWRAFQTHRDGCLPETRSARASHCTEVAGLGGQGGGGPNPLLMAVKVLMFEGHQEPISRHASEARQTTHKQKQQKNSTLQHTSFGVSLKEHTLKTSHNLMQDSKGGH